MRRIKLHPIEKEILRSLENVELMVTTNKIAEAIGIHSSTVKNHVEKLEKEKLIITEKRGNRTYCKINFDEMNDVEIA